MLQFQEAEKSAENFKEKKWKSSLKIKNSFSSKTLFRDITWDVVPPLPKAHAHWIVNLEWWQLHYSSTKTHKDWLCLLTSFSHDDAHCIIKVSSTQWHNKGKTSQDVQIKPGIFQTICKNCWVTQKSLASSLPPLWRDRLENVLPLTGLSSGGEKKKILFSPVLSKMTARRAQTIQEGKESQFHTH